MAISLFYETLIKNIDPHNQKENDYTHVIEYPNDPGDTEINKTSAISNFIPKILAHD